MSLASALIAHVTAPLGAEELSRARLHVLDWAGCVLGAAREPLVADLRSGLGGQGGDTPSFGLGPLRFDAARDHAAALGNVLEMDDLAKTALLHPAPVIIPAAVYAGLSAGAVLRDVLEAVVRGYEAAIRLGQSLDPFHYARWHPTTTAGAPGAAIAAAVAQGGGAAKATDAMQLALSVSGGLWHMRHGGGTTKQWHAVHAVRTGMAAAEAAGAGFVGAPQIIEGAQGWHEVLAEAPQPEKITQAAPWALHETSFKPWPACRHCHPAIDAAMMHEAAADSIAHIEIETYADALKFCDNSAPQTPAEARFSLQHCVALSMLKTKPTPADFEREALGATEVAALRSKVTVREAASFTSAYPAHFGAEVKVTDQSGAATTHIVPDALGDPEWPLSPAQVREKFDMLVAWGGFDAAALAEFVLNAANDTPISALREVCP